MTGIAVTGIDCRFPGARDRHELWRMLSRGGHGIRPVPRLRWDAERFRGDPDQPGTTNTGSGGFIDDPDAFDHEFFTISPREAAAMDPQQRLLLQAAWRAIEDSGTDPRSLAGTDTGVYVGMMSSEWASMHMLDLAGMTTHRGSGNGYCMAANRISYHLDLKGPSISVDTACSSSLVATHLACTALAAGECDWAIAAGVNLILTPALSIFYSQAGLSAPDGHCKPFSAKADGIGRGEGVGVVVLRRVEDALADGQPIYAVVEGSAVNQDGRSNGITAPNRFSQREVIAAACRRARVEPAQVTFVEGHGTGTVLGDMIEAKALGDVHGVDRQKACLLGSIKGNIGHTEGAAGIAALIKTCLALAHRLVPPSLHSHDENPNLRLAGLGLRLAKAPVRLPPGRVLAGVSSFGLGGTNAHMVLATPSTDRWPVRPGGVGVFTLSANSPDGLRRQAAAMTAALTDQPVDRIGQVCHMSNRVKSSLRHRMALPVSTRDELLRGLGAVADGTAPDTVTGAARSAPRVGLMFTGQGSQYPRMTRALYQASRPYRQRLDEIDEVLAGYLGRSVRQLLWHDGEELHRTEFAQPALFAVEYALGRALLDLGVEPAFLVGHSVGEYAAACLAGALTVESACRLIVARGAIMQAIGEDGAMLSVRAHPEAVAPLVDAEPLVGLAAVNGPRSVVVSGDRDAVGRIAERLAGDGVRTTPLRVSHAFHSPLMRPALEPFAEQVAGLVARAPRIPIVSTVSGRVVGGSEMDADYWTGQITAPVLFSQAVTAGRQFGATHLVEIGPRAVLLPLARQAGLGREVGGLVPCPGERATGRELAETVAALYRDGLAPRWTTLYEPSQLAPCRLAPYVFADRGRFWTSTPATAGTGTVESVVRLAPASAGTQEQVAHPPVPGPASHDPVVRGVLAAVADVGGYPVGDLGLDLTLQEDLGYDSIMVVQLVDRIAALTGTVPPSVAETLPNIATVADLVSFVRDQSKVA